MSLHHQLAPSAPLSDVLVQLDGRGTGPQHAGAGGVHVGQVVERQDVARLKIKPELIEGPSCFGNQSRISINDGTFFSAI